MISRNKFNKKIRGNNLHFFNSFFFFFFYNSKIVISFTDYSPLNMASHPSFRGGLTSSSTSILSLSSSKASLSILFLLILKPTLLLSQILSTYAIVFVVQIPITNTDGIRKGCETFCHRLYYLLHVLSKCVRCFSWKKVKYRVLHLTLFFFIPIEDNVITLLCSFV